MASPSDPSAGRGPLRARRWLWLPAVALGTAGGAALLLAPMERATDAPKAHSADAGPPPIPVIAVPVRRGDVHVYLTGLGAVTPLRTVTVKTRVDGELVRVRFEEGQIVTKGAVLAELDARPYQAQVLLAEGQLNRDQASLENAKRDLARYQLLAAQDSISNQIYETQRALVHQDEGVVEADRGQLDAARLNVVYARITSPITGRVGLRLVDPGNIVHATDTNGLVVLTQLQPISIVFTIAEDSLPPLLAKLRAGERPPVDAFNRDLTRKVAAGNLLTVDNEIDPTTGTVKLKALFGNEDNALFPSQFVNARLLLDTEPGATLAPIAAIQRGPGKAFVYVVKDDRSVELREVTLGPSEADVVAIKTGLSPGEMVVVDGADKLRAGSRVVTSTPDAGAGDGGYGYGYGEGGTGGPGSP